MPKIWRKFKDPCDLDTETLFDILVALFVAMALGILMAVVLQGCNEQDMETTVYKTLKVSAISYDAAMKSAVDLYTEDHITPDQMDSIIDAATKYRAAYLSCVSLLEAYHNIRDPTVADQGRIKSTVFACTEALADLIAIVTEYRARLPTPE